jgi:hydrogenase nickel incorporation protein HypB
VDLNVLRANVRDVNPNAPVFELSCKTGQGLPAWLEWLDSAVAARNAARRTAATA